MSLPRYVPKNDPLIFMHHTAHYVNLTAPKPCDINILDIAHALARVNRFNGHTSESYSVAQHSVLVAQNVPEEHKLSALLHDASEAYLGDISTPLKQLLPDYKALEHKWQHAIAQAFGLPGIMHVCIKQADLRALATEKRDLFPGASADTWHALDGAKPYPQQITPLGEYIAKRRFLDYFHRLTAHRYVA